MVYYLFDKTPIGLQRETQPQCPKQYPHTYDGDCIQGGFCCNVSDIVDSGYCGEFSGLVNDCNGKSVRCYAIVEKTNLTTESLACGNFLDVNDMREDCELNPKCFGWSIHGNDTYHKRSCLKGTAEPNSLVNTETDEKFTSYYVSNNCGGYEEEDKTLLKG